MSLPTYEQAMATSRDEPAFPNGTGFEGWKATHCDRCINDLADRQGDPGNGCPLILVALLGRTPIEWATDKPGSRSQQYRRWYFRHEDDGDDPEPAPVPDPPGQLTLAPRAPFEQARMLTTYPTPTEATR